MLARDSPKTVTLPGYIYFRCSIPSDVCTVKCLNREGLAILTPTMNGESNYKAIYGRCIDLDQEHRTVLVKSLSPSTDKQNLTIYFQSRKNCGGEIQELILLGNGSAVITFEEEKVAKSILKKEQILDGVILSVEPYKPQALEMQADVEVFSKVLATIQPNDLNISIEETHAILEEVREKTKVELNKPHHKSGVYMLTGSFQQIQKSHRLLQDILSQGIVCNGNESRKRVEITTLREVPEAKQTGNGVEEISEKKNESRNPLRQSFSDKVKQTTNQYSESFKGTNTSKNEPATQQDFSLNKEVKERKHTEDSSENYATKSPSLSTTKAVERNQASKTKVSSPDSSLNNDDKSKQMSEAPSPILQGEHENKGGKTKTAKVKYEGSISTGEKTMDFTKIVKISFKEWHVFVKMYEGELKSIMDKFSVQIEPKDNTSVAVIKLLGDYNKENLTMATRKLTVLYEEAKSKMNSVLFVLADPESQEDNNKLRQTISVVEKTLPVVLEKAADRQSWEMFGESYQVENGMKLLVESVKLRRKELEVDYKTIEESDSEEEMDIDSDTTNGDDDDDDDDDCNGKLVYYLGKVKLSVYKGDITGEDCDAIVNAANENLHHGAGVAGAIVAKGGSSIQDECRTIVRKKGKLKVGEATITHSGDLKCKMIIHAVGPNWGEEKGEKGKALLTKACTESLVYAQKYSFKSIAFPVISSGFPKPICAAVMFDVAEEYSKGVTSSDAFGLLDIRFVNHDVKTVKVFRREFKARYGNGILISENQDDPSRGNASFPRISRTWKKESNSTLETEIKIPEPSNKHSAVTYVARQAGKRETLPRYQANGQPHSYHGVRPKQPSVNISTDNKEKKIARHQKQPSNDNIYHVPPNDVKKPSLKSHSRHRGVSQSDSLSGGARPKQASVHVSKGTKHREEHQPDKLECPICLNKLIHPETLPKCQHTFCKNCLKQALQKSPWCPYCKDPQPFKGSRQNRDTRDPRQDHYGFSGLHPNEVQWRQQDSQSRNPHLFGQQFGQTFDTVYQDQEELLSPDHEYLRKPRSRRGNEGFDSYSFDDNGQEQSGFSSHRRESVQMQRGRQPPGSMKVREDAFTLPGYEQSRTIVIQYSFSGGLQGPEHPNPGQMYGGTHRAAYLPDSSEGRKVLRLLQKAFEVGLIFKIGRSMTSRIDNQIIWADIPHKTDITGGPYGYPDPTYLADVKQQLKAALSEQ